MRPLRRANFSGLLLGEHVFPEADRTRIVIPATQTKMGKGPMPPTGRTRFGVLTAALFGAPITLSITSEPSRRRPWLTRARRTSILPPRCSAMPMSAPVISHIRASGLIAARRSHEWEDRLLRDTCENET